MGGGYPQGISISCVYSAGWGVGQGRICLIHKYPYNLESWNITRYLSTPTITYIPYIKSQGFLSLLVKNLPLNLHTRVLSGEGTLSSKGRFNHWWVFVWTKNYTCAGWFKCKRKKPTITQVNMSQHDPSSRDVFDLTQRISTSQQFHAVNSTKLRGIWEALVFFATSNPTFWQTKMTIGGDFPKKNRYFAFHDSIMG